MKILKFLIKSLWSIIKFLFKEIASFIIKGALLLVIIGVIIAVSIKEPKENKKVAKPGSYIKIDMSQKYSEPVEYLPKFLMGEKGNFYGLIKKLNIIKEDKNISGIFLKLDNLTLSNGQIEELEKKLEELKKSGKNIIAYAENLDNKNYSLALSGNKIAMPFTHAAGINITGYYTEVGYYKGLADKIGVDFNVIHVGDYKAFGENYVRKSMSQEYRENITQLKDQVYENFVNRVARYRKLPFNRLNSDILEGKFVNGDIEEIYKYGLIDELIDESSLIAKIGKDKVITLEEYDINEKEKVQDKIAIVYVDGEIYADDGDTNEIISGITPRKIEAQLNQAISDKSIKGIVFRINSPGGSALASNIINRKINEIKGEKPVYVSIGGVAASGGYYIAAAGDRIFADKESITGSIGVVSIIPNVKKLLEKADVNMEVIKKGKYSDLYSLTNEFTADDRKKIYDSSLKVYDEFLGVVAKSRGKSTEYINSIGQGKVWLGEQGKDLGLVDEIGGLEDTVKALAQSIDIEEYGVVEIVDRPKISTVFKSNMPFIKSLYKIENLMNNRNLYFRPLYYFPYEI